VLDKVLDKVLDEVLDKVLDKVLDPTTPSLRSWLRRASWGLGQSAYVHLLRSMWSLWLIQPLWGVRVVDLALVEHLVVNLVELVWTRPVTW